MADLVWCYGPTHSTNYSPPEIAQVGVAVLEAAGFDVNIPNDVLCCGRPLYDFGMPGSRKEILAANPMGIT